MWRKAAIFQPENWKQMGRGLASWDIVLEHWALLLYNQTIGRTQRLRPLSQAGAAEVRAFRGESKMDIIAKDSDIVIRRMEANADEFHLYLKWMTDPETMKYWEGMTKHYTYEMVVQEHEDSVGEGVIRCIIEWAEKPIGFCQFCVLDPQSYEVSPEKYREFVKEFETAYGIDIFLGEAGCRDRGIGTRCMKLLVQTLFEDYHADVVLIDPKVHNQRAIACYHKCGFTDCFVEPHRELQDGVCHDSLIMSIRRRTAVTLSNYVCAFLENDGRLLLMKRAADRKLNPNYWSGIGGKIEPDELNDPHWACLREIWEETGIVSENIRNLELRYIITRRHEKRISQSYIYFGESKTDRVADTDEGKLYWIPKAEVVDKEYTPTYREMIKHYFSPNADKANIFVGAVENRNGGLHINWSKLEDFE